MAAPRRHDFTSSALGTPLIYDVLRQDIVVLRVRPGERLSENELAARFGTSRAPVREALIRLVDDGLIEVRPQRGSFVSRISLRAIERARFVREELEAAIVRRAAMTDLSRDVQSDLERVIGAQIDSADDPERFTQLDDQFHRAFAVRSGLAGVWDVIEREKAQFDRIRFLSLPRSTPVATLVAQHRQILDAVSKRDPDGADHAVRTHLREVLTIIDELASVHADLFVHDL